MLRSIDMQQVILQSNAVERVQQVQQRHPDMQQKYFSAELNKERQEQQEKVGQSVENEQIRLQTEKDRQERKRRQARHSEDVIDEESGRDDEKEFGRINIRV